LDGTYDFPVGFRSILSPIAAFNEKTTVLHPALYRNSIDCYQKIYNDLKIPIKWPQEGIADAG
jgi:hypothetical protein